MSVVNRETNIIILPLREEDKDTTDICICDCPCVSSKYAKWKSGKTQTFGVDITMSVIRRNMNVSPVHLDKGNFYGRHGVRAQCVVGTQFITAEEYKLEQNSNIITMPQECVITIGPSVERNSRIPNGTIYNLEGGITHETLGTELITTDNLTLEIGTIVSIDVNTSISFSIPYFGGQLICQNVNVPFEIMCMAN